MTDRRPRLLFIVTQVYADGGIQRFNRTLFTATDRLPVDYDVYSLNDAEAPPAMPHTSVRCFARSKVRFAQAVLRAIWFGRYTAVIVGHVNFAFLAAAALRSHPLRRPPAMLIAHGTDVWSGIRGQRRWALKSIDSILCVSSYTRSMIERQAPELPRDRYVAFPNALNDSWIRLALSVKRAADPPSRQGDLPQRFLLSVSRLSRFDRTKGIVTVIETLPTLKDSGVHYVIAGDGDDRPQLQDIAARVGVADRVHFLGAVSDERLVDLYRRCTTFVLPSCQEGFGIVFLEAMYFDAPVVAAAEKGAVDVVQHEQTGLTVPYGDTVQLGAALDRLLDDQTLRDRLRRQARASVTDHGKFTFAAFADRWATVLRHYAVC